MVVGANTNCCIDTRRRIVTKKHGIQTCLLTRILRMEEEPRCNDGDCWWVEDFIPVS